jgi:hypothetical protein
MEGQTTVIDCGQQRERLLKEKIRREMRESSRVMLRAYLPSPAAQPRSDTVVGAHFGRTGQAPEMGPQKASSLVKRTEVGEGR